VKRGDVAVNLLVFNRSQECDSGLHTWVMQIYSGKMERRFIPSVAQMAIVVDATAMEATVSGPRSLQSKSIRRIRALRAILVCQYIVFIRRCLHVAELLN